MNKHGSPSRLNPACSSFAPEKPSPSVPRFPGDDAQAGESVEVPAWFPREGSGLDREELFARDDRPMMEACAVAQNVGVQLYTVREFTNTAEGLVESLKKIRQIGYTAVEMSPFGPLEREELKKVLDGEGLLFPSTHLGVDQILNDFDRVSETLLFFDCRHVASSGRASDADGYKKLAADLSQAAEKLEKVGIALSYHNHHWEFQKYGDRTGLQILVDETDPKVNFQLDTYWVQEGGGDPIDWIRSVSGRIPYLHLKDMTIIDAKVHMAEVGEGNLNWPGIFAAAKEAGTQWFIVEQDHCQRDPFESIAISLRNLKAWGIAS